MGEPNAEILVEDGKERGRVVALRPTKTVEIGREGNFRLDDSALSRRHARVWFDGTGYRLEDAGSSWGTFVNGMRVKSHALRHGDRIRLGGHTLLFTVSGEAAAPHPVEETEDIPMAPKAGPAIPAIPAAPAARVVEPPTATPAHLAPMHEPEDEEADAPVPDGVCFNCGKQAPPRAPGAPPDPLGHEPHCYCGSCAQQYPFLGRVLANHLCEKILGAGGMGVVYRGTHVVMGRFAAMKTLRIMDDADPTLVKRLLREATAGGRIHHPNIVAVHDTGEQDGEAYVVMEYIRGENLAEALRHERKFPVARAVHMGRKRDAFFRYLPPTRK